MILRLAERLDVPLRERNLMLLSAGYAPVYPERRLDDPALAPARRAIDLVLEGHAPCPALALDRHWTMVAANAAVPPLLAGLMFRKMFQRMGFIRYMVFINLLLLMAALPIKMVLRWSLNLKYLVAIPEYFFNI